MPEVQCRIRGEAVEVLGSVDIPHPLAARPVGHHGERVIVVSEGALFTLNQLGGLSPRTWWV